MRFACTCIATHLMTLASVLETEWNLFMVNRYYCITISIKVYILKNKVDTWFCPTLLEQFSHLDAFYQRHRLLHGRLASGTLFPHLINGAPFWNIHNLYQLTEMLTCEIPLMIWQFYAQIMHWFTIFLWHQQRKGPHKDNFVTCLSVNLSHVAFAGTKRTPWLSSWIWFYWGFYYALRFVQVDFPVPVQSGGRLFFSTSISI